MLGPGARRLPIPKRHAVGARRCDGGWRAAWRLGSGDAHRPVRRLAPAMLGWDAGRAFCMVALAARKTGGVGAAKLVLGVGCAWRASFTWRHAPSMAG